MRATRLKKENPDMNITINVDCSPEEARRFLGLPDVQPLQATVMEELQKQMLANLQAMDPEQLMKAWMPSGVAGGMKSIEEMQKAFWSQMTAAASKPGGSGS